MFVFWWMIKFKHSVEVFILSSRLKKEIGRLRRIIFWKTADIYLILSEASLFFFPHRCLFCCSVWHFAELCLTHTNFFLTSAQKRQSPKKKIMRHVFDERLLTTSSSAEFWSEKTSWTSLTDCQRLFGDSRCQKMSQLSERLCRVAVFGGCCLSEENKTAEVTASSLSSLNICNTTNHPVSPANI